MKIQNTTRANKIISLVFAASVALVGYSIIATMAAGAASMFSKPANGTFNPEQSVTVEVRINTAGEPVNAVQADFTYDESRLEYQNIDGDGSAFSIAADSSGGNGNVSIARGSITNVNGKDLLVAKVNFKVLKNGGDAKISFSDSSAIVRSSDSSNILGTTSGSLFTVTGPADTSQSSSGTGSSSNPDGSSSFGSGQEENTTSDNQSEQDGSEAANAGRQSAGTGNTNRNLLYAGLIGLGISLLGGTILFLKKRGIFPFKSGGKGPSGPDDTPADSGTGQQPPTVPPSDWQDPDNQNSKE